MPTVTINADGSITVALNPQDQGLAVMLREERGPEVLTAVFNLWFTNEVKTVMNERFARLPAQDQVDLLTKMSQAKPKKKPDSIPVTPLP